MMLAAPGASHPHDGKLDWLVPVLLAAVQYLYLAALGFELGVPGPVVFAACALTAIWYASIVVGEGGAGLYGAIGWEARMFGFGLAAVFGVPIVGYLGLAAYLGVLVCQKVVLGYLTLMEEIRR
jgi:hypothetical protein